MPRSPAPEPEIVALKGLAFLAASPAEFERFLGQSGLAPDDVRRAAGDADFLAGVLDFLLSGDELLLAFCAAESLEPRNVHRARAHLGRTSPRRKP